VPPSTSHTARNILVTALAVVAFFASTGASDEKRVAVYSAVASYSVAVADRAGREYISLLEILEPLGRISAHSEGGRWKMRFNESDCEFIPGRPRGKIRGRDVDLGAPFLLENTRGMVPLGALGTVLPRLLGNAVSYREPARRLLIGDVATRVTAQLEGGPPPRLVLSFSAPVNPTISTEPGKLHMLFTREPLVPPGNTAWSFDNPAIAQATFSEGNGTVDLTVAGKAPLMASFSDGGRTITVAAIASGSVPAGMQANPVPDMATGPADNSQAPGTAPAVPLRRLVVVVDPSHGGAERGAALSDTLAEKTVTLGFARLLRHELERQGFAVVLLRDGDETLSLDQRAGAANATHPALYIALHAASEGAGARVYTALLPVAGQDRGTFRAWNTAQASALPNSQAAAAAVVAEMQKHQIPARAYAASLQPLNHLLAPALAVELAPGPNGVADLPSANYQQKAAAAVADGVAAMRDRLGGQP